MAQIFETTLTDISGLSTSGRAEVLDLDSAARFKRASKKGAVFFFAGLIFVPVPFIHFFLPPAFFIFAAFSFFATLKETRIVPKIEALCPACGSQVQFLNHKFDGVQKDVCPSCRQQLRIVIR